MNTGSDKKNGSPAAGAIVRGVVGPLGLTLLTEPSRVLALAGVPVVHEDTVAVVGHGVRGLVGAPDARAGPGRAPWVVPRVGVRTEGRVSVLGAELTTLKVSVHQGLQKGVVEKRKITADNRNDTCDSRQDYQGKSDERRR